MADEERTSRTTPVPGKGPGRARLEEIHRDLADEHRRIMTLVERLERHRGLTDLPTLLEELHELLVDHFAHEQFPGGLYEALGAFDSAYHEELRLLVREHCELLSYTRGVLERSRVAVAADAMPLLHEVGTVIARLREHEHREHALTSKLLAD